MSHLCDMRRDHSATSQNRSWKFILRIYVCEYNHTDEDLSCLSTYRYTQMISIESHFLPSYVRTMRESLQTGWIGVKLIGWLTHSQSCLCYTFNVQCAMCVCKCREQHFALHMHILHLFQFDRARAHMHILESHTLARSRNGSRTYNGTIADIHIQCSCTCIHRAKYAKTHWQSASHTPNATVWGCTMHTHTQLRLAQLGMLAGAHIRYIAFDFIFRTKLSCAFSFISPGWLTVLISFECMQYTCMHI